MHPVVEFNEMKLHQSECLSNYNKHTPLWPVLYMQCEQEVNLLCLVSVALAWFTFTHNITYLDLHTVYQTPCPVQLQIPSPPVDYFHELNWYLKLLHILISPKNGVISCKLHITCRTPKMATTCYFLCSDMMYHIKTSNSPLLEPELDLVTYFINRTSWTSKDRL